MMSSKASLSCKMLCIYYCMTFAEGLHFSAFSFYRWQLQTVYLHQFHKGWLTWRLGSSQSGYHLTRPNCSVLAAGRPQSTHQTHGGRRKYLISFCQRMPTASVIRTKLIRIKIASIRHKMLHIRSSSPAFRVWWWGPQSSKRAIVRIGFVRFKEELLVQWDEPVFQ